MGEYDQKDWSACDKFGIIMLFLATYILEVGARVSLRVTTKNSFRDRNILKI